MDESNKREKTVESYLRDKVRDLGGWSLKFICPGVSGIPDRLVLYEGRAYFVEVKRKGKEPSKLQRYVHSLLLKVGFKVWIVDDRASVNHFLDEIQAA